MHLAQSLVERNQDLFDPFWPFSSPKMRWFLLSALAAPTTAKVVIEAMEHDIMQIQASTFDGIISKFRDSSVSSAFAAHRGDVWGPSSNSKA